MSQPRGNGFRGRGRGQRRPYSHGPQPYERRPYNGVSQMEHSPMQTDSVGTETPKTTASSPERDTSHLSDKTFASLAGRIDPSLLSAIPFPQMSLVQAATFDTILSGVDVLAQAKTGTGKTIAFLLPAIQSLIVKPPQKIKPCLVSILILSPTRELALQIEKEARMLLTGNCNLGIQHCIGGTNMTTEKNALQTSRCDLLVATPGRLMDHIENSDLVPQLSKVRVVVLDEADRMLDMGFRDVIKKIMSHLSPRSVQKRQSLLFSATIPPGIRETADLDKNCAFINTLKPGEENTHEHVPQEYMVVSSEDMFAATLSLLQKCFEENPTACKVMIFFTTARLTGLFASLLEMLKAQSSHQDVLKSVSLFEIHSRKSQSSRVKAATQFSQTKAGILCSSDVTARGVDFPGVTHVFQVGLPASGEQYIHRLGRTARAGASGSGVLIINKAEKFFLQKPEMRTLTIQERSVKPDLPLCKARVDQAFMSIPDQEKAQAYSSSLGYYKGFLKSLKWTSSDLVHEMNEFARLGMLWNGGQVGLAPPLMAKTVGKMGLKGVPGLNIVKVMPWADEEGAASSSSNKRRLPEEANAPIQVRPRQGERGLHTQQGPPGGSRGGRGGRGRGAANGGGRGRGGFARGS